MQTLLWKQNPSGQSGRIATGFAVRWAIARAFAIALFAAALFLSPFSSTLSAQEAAQPSAAGDDEPGVVDTTKQKAEELADKAKAKVDEFAKQVDADDRAHEAKDSILKPIYLLAERLSFAWFHWLAFAAMATGTVSFALQLVLGKLVVLSKSGFSLSEILSDLLGLFISVVGLVLTTQAATENSSFTESAFSVLSASAVGLVLGFFFYVKGQRQELDALESRKGRSE